MNVYRNTPLEQFTGSHGLSVRALNVCRSNGIVTLGDLLNCSPEALPGLRNCGAKSAAELSALRAKYLSAPADLFTDILRRGLQESFLRAKKQLSDKQNSLIEKAMGAFGIDAKTTGCFVETPFIFIDNVVNADPKLRNDILEAMAELFAAWKTETASDAENVALLNANLRYVEQLRARYEAENIFDSLPVTLQNLLNRRYREKFNAMSVRTINAMSFLADLRNAIPYIFGTRILDSQKLKNAGARTLMEMEAFLNNRKAKLLDIFTIAKKGGKAWDDRMASMFAADIAARFPFLNHDEVMLVADTEKMGRSPQPLFLLERYVMHSDSRPAKIYAMRYGIGRGGKRMHCADIGRILGLSGERVRQLASSQLPVPAELGKILSGSFAWITEKVVSEDNPAWNMEIKRAELSESVPQLMALATALKPEYITVQLSPEAKTWIVAREILSGVNLMTSLRLLTQTIEMKRTKSETFSIAPYIFMGKSRDEFHPDVDLLHPIYLECISHFNNVIVNPDGTFTATPNKLDIISALEDVLEKIGKSVSYSELCDAFDTSNPGQLSDTRRQLRSYIFRSKLIAPVGRSGRYVMKHWENAFSGTVVQCMAMELRNAGEPLSASELHKRVKKFFPTTSVNSINVFAYLDKGRTIIMLPDKRYVLAGTGYDSLAGNNRRCVSFDSRFEALEAFVGEHRRFPLLSDSDYVSLRRWLDNVRHGVVILPYRQRAQLDDFIRRNLTLPITSSQASFRRHVYSVIQHVCRFGTMPSSVNGSLDYHWLQRIRQSKRPYGDLRDTDYLHLQSFLTNFGYSI